MPDASTVRPRPRRWIVFQYSLGGVAAVMLIAIGSLYLLRRTSTDASIRDAQEKNRVMVAAVVQPALTNNAVVSASSFVDTFDAEVRARLLPAGATRVKLWDAEGRIVYSDERRLIGEQFELGAAERDVLRSGGSHAGVSDLKGAENRFERQGRSLLEVYRRVRTPDGTPLLFETYFDYSAVAAARDTMWRHYASTVFGMLAALAVLQVGLAGSLSRRMRANHGEREELFLRAMRASESERERIARDLHDGIVQDLAGVSFMIAGALDQIGPNVDPSARTGLREASAATRRGIRQLRTLLVDLYPLNLRSAGLESALSDLLARAQSEGLATSLEYDNDVELADEDQELGFRVAQEAIRNTLRHAAASRIDVTVTRLETQTVLEIRDDGGGFDPTATPPKGHFGLRLLADAASARNAMLQWSSSSGEGTLLRLELGP